MDNKKTAEVKVMQLADEQVESIINAVVEKTNKHVDEMIAKLDGKSVVVQKSDVRKALEDLMAEEKKAEEKAKAETPAVKTENKVQIIDDESEEDKVKFPIRVFLKYLGIGAVGAGIGVAGKMVYDDRKAKKAAGEGYVDASYDVSTADYN